jgi:6-phosphogluconolactonase (cycloisomerase 2 family)
LNKEEKVSVPGVYVQSNEGAANRVFGFRRGADGQLTAPIVVPSGGPGDDVPHLTSQGSVVLTSDGRLLVTNAGSDDISLLTVADEPQFLAVVPSGGPAPKSIAERDGFVYVLNTGDRSLVGFSLSRDGLVEVPGSRRELGAGADPAQVGFTPDGRSVVVTDRGANAILVYPVAAGGLLGEPNATPSAGPTPYGFAFAQDDTLVVTEAYGAAKGKAAASSYRLDGGGAEVVTSSVGNGRSEICWAVPSADGHYVFTTNFADGAVSRYRVASGGELVLDDAVAAVTFDGVPGLRDEDITADGRFLYAIDADGGRVFGWRVDDGALSPVGSWNGLPTTVAGLAAN